MSRGGVFSKKIYWNTTPKNTKRYGGVSDLAGDSGPQANLACHEALGQLGQDEPAVVAATSSRGKLVLA